MRDNGIGGLRQVPHSLASRVDGFRGGVQVNELVGQGTTVTITAGRAIGGGR
jgi:hypothetical protein